MRVIIGN